MLRVGDIAFELIVNPPTIQKVSPTFLCIIRDRGMTPGDGFSSAVLTNEGSQLCPADSVSDFHIILQLTVHGQPMMGFPSCAVPEVVSTPESSVLQIHFHAPVGDR